MDELAEIKQIKQRLFKALITLKDYSYEVETENYWDFCFVPVSVSFLDSDSPKLQPTFLSVSADGLSNIFYPTELSVKLDLSDYSKDENFLDQIEEAVQKCLSGVMKHLVDEGRKIKEGNGFLSFYFKPAEILKEADRIKISIPAACLFTFEKTSFCVGI